MIRSVMAAAGSASSVLLLGAALSDERASGPQTRAVEGRMGRRTSPRTMAVVTGLLGVAAGGFLAGPPGLLGGGVAGVALPIGLERRRRVRRIARTEEQLLDAVTAIASSVRAGRSLVQSIGFAAGDVGPPLGTHLRDAADRVALGVAVDEVLADLAETIGGPDARLVTGVLGLHRRAGGAMASSLDDLVRTLRARRDGARDLRSLTAQARLSAAILGLLPLGFFLFLSVVARRDVEGAYRTTVGASAIGIGLVLQGAAFVWIRRLLRVEAV